MDHALASNDVVLDYLRQYSIQKRECESAQGVLRNIVKRAKADGINVKALTDAHRALKLDPGEVSAHLREFIRIVNLRNGGAIERDELFDWDTDVAPATRHADDIWDAENAGYIAGRNGVDIRECLYDPGSEQHAAWLREHQKGQAAIAREMGPGVERAPGGRSRPRQLDIEDAIEGEGGEGDEIPPPSPTYAGRKKRAGKTVKPKAPKQRTAAARARHVSTAAPMN